MGVVSVTLPTDGTGATVSQYNTPISAIVNEFNGNIDNNNIKASAAIATTKIAQDAGLTGASLAQNAVTGDKLATSAITLGYTQITASVGPSPTSTTDVDIAGVTVTVTVPAGGRRLKVTVAGSDYEQTGGIGTVYAVLKIKEGTTVLGSSAVTPVTANFPNGFIAVASFVAAAGSHTYKFSLANNATGPNFTIGASTTAPVFILAELI